jgi:murein DD-endopeptidase MepM/ murein hydrolase activator NlpD
MGLRTRLRALAVVLAASSALALGVAAPAHAASYPTWSDVKKARANVQEQAKEVAKIKALLADSKAAADRTEKVAEQRGAVYQGMRDRVDTASARLDVIKKEVAADKRKAAQASQRAGMLAAQLSRTGGTDVQTTLFFSGSKGQGAEQFLAKLGRLSKLTEANGSIAAEAVRAKNTASATQAQMKQATDELVGLKKQAEAAYNVAVQANEAANAQVQKEQANQVKLQALLDALQATSESTEAGFNAGVKARLRAQSVGTGGSVVSTGWALPAVGPITDGFGPRPDQPAGANLFHRGTDIGAACGNSIYAAFTGTVIYAGWYGTYGNFIEIRHSNGISTGYAHIRPGGTFVHVGQSVKAGQNIASVGETGAATGCHLHFETRINEVAVNAVPFMAARGVTLG